MYKLAALAVAAVVAAAAFSGPAVARERSHSGQKMKHGGDNYRGGDRHRRRGGVAIGIGENGVFISKKRKHRRNH